MKNDQFDTMTHEEFLEIISVLQEAAELHNDSTDTAKFATKNYYFNVNYFAIGLTLFTLTFPIVACFFYWLFSTYLKDRRGRNNRKFGVVGTLV